MNRTQTAEHVGLPGYRSGFPFLGSANDLSMMGNHHSIVARSGAAVGIRVGAMKAPAILNWLEANSERRTIGVGMDHSKLRYDEEWRTLMIP
jgi:hypothetical protein